MVKKFLKIAGVKNEQEFYKKYPTESAFFKAHPEAKDLKMYKKGGEMKKLKQLTSYEGDIDGIVPQFQNAPYPILPGNQTNDYLGLSNPPSGGTMNLASNASLTNPYMYGTSSSINQAPVLGGTVPEQIKGMNMNVPVGKQKFDFLGKMGGPMGVANLATGLIGGFQALGAEKKARKEAEAQARVSDVVLQASLSRPKDIARRQYNRPEDALINPNELYPTYGTGTEVLASAQDGISINQIGGNPTEIQNVYNPGTIYSDMGYEPINDSDQVKQYRYGGVKKGQLGLTSTQFGQLSNIGGQIGGMIGGNNAGSGIGGTLGSTVGTVFGGPIGGAVGNFLGSAVGGLLDTNVKNTKAAQERTQRNMQKAAFQSGIQGLQSQYGSYMKNGGSIDSDYEWISHTWQPQVITKFGDVDVSDIHNIATEGMDTLRTGGNIRQNYTYPQDQFAFGGELQTTWGGRAETMSYNPYLPGSGEMVMFRGNSHEEKDHKGRTGIGVKYGNNGEYNPYMEYGKNGVEDVTDVEVERGEPAVELPDVEQLNNGGQESSMNVYGNLMVNKQMFPDYAGMKYKNAAKKIGEDTARQNKIIEKNADKNLETYTPFDVLAMNSANANVMGANMKLKKYANDLQALATEQNKVNKISDTLGLDADALAKGKFVPSKESEQQAKWGKSIKKAQDGYTSKYGIKPWKGNVTGLGRKTASQFTAKEWDEIADKLGFKGRGNKEFEEFLINNPEAKKIIEERHQKLYGKSTWIDPEHFGAGWAAPELKDITKEKPEEKPFDVPEKPKEQPVEEKQKDVDVVPTETPKKKGTDWLSAINTVLPYFQKPYESPLPNLYPEMYALATNVYEPVKAQGVQPLLETPYDISLQDQLNEVTAASRSAQRMAGGDPSALASIAAGEQAAKQKILGEQFRMNQAERAGVYGRNRQVLNQAQLQNLQIYADQEQKQQMAKAMTKATAQEALASMADKIDKRRAEDRKMRLYENLFPNYTLTPDGRMIPKGLTLFPGATVPGATGSGIPAQATNPYVLEGRNSSTTSTKTVDSYPNVSLMPGVTVVSRRSPYQNIPSIDELYAEETVYPTQQKKGGKTKKKLDGNGFIVKSLKKI